MDINSNSLRYFNHEGLTLIYQSILAEFERFLEEGDFEGQEEFQSELQEQYKKLNVEDALDSPHKLANLLYDAVFWLNTHDNMEAFGSEGWEHACGLDYF